MVPVAAELSTAELSVVRLSVCPSRLRGGGGDASVTFLLFFGMELPWDDINHISKDRFG